VVFCGGVVAYNFACAHGPLLRMLPGEGRLSGGGFCAGRWGVASVVGKERRFLGRGHPKGGGAREGVPFG